MTKITKLQNARELSGKTQEQIAVETEMNLRVYQNYEYGVNQRAIKNAVRIARAVGSTVEQIWGDKPKNQTV